MSLYRLPHPFFFCVTYAWFHHSYYSYSPLTIFTIGFEIFFFVPRSYDFAIITIPPLQRHSTHNNSRNDRLLLCHFRDVIPRRGNNTVVDGIYDPCRRVLRSPPSWELIGDLEWICGPRCCYWSKGKKKQTSSVYDCTVKDVEYICNILRY